MSLQENIRFLNQSGFEIADEQESGLGFVVRRSPYSDYGANLGFSHRRGFYVSVGSRERDTTEIKNLASALNALAEVAESLNQYL